LDLEMFGRRRSNPLTNAFLSFHSEVRTKIHFALMAGSITAITFSDSVFFATKRVDVALRFASELTFSLLSQGVPIRTGIALGSFATLRFRSDVQKDGGDHASQVLGTAVARACRAESCGVKGIRVLIHPSMEPLIQSPWLMMELAESERANKSSVRYELNYWDLKASKERAAWQKLQELWSSAPELAKVHYEAAANAIDRMRAQKGELPVTNLTQRTPPRRRGREFA
jgi:hypothetical protein